MGNWQKVTPAHLRVAMLFGLDETELERKTQGNAAMLES
jgi:hypothetical protein